MTSVQSECNCSQKRGRVGGRDCWRAVKTIDISMHTNTHTHRKERERGRDASLWEYVIKFVQIIKCSKCNSNGYAHIKQMINHSIN